MSTLKLGEAVTDGALERVRFFNGRLLSGADMTREQGARDGGDAALGAALGSGVAFGLEVTRSATDMAESAATVTVRAGLAIAPSGKVLRLNGDQRLGLIRQDSSSFASAATGTFGACGTAAAGTYVAGEGLYLLTLSPAQVAAGRAQVNGLQGDAVSCNVDRDLAGACFRLLEIRPFLYDALTPADPAYRNRIAYRCFGARVGQPWAASLFTQADAGQDMIDAMASQGLGADDVPLAIIGFSGILDVTFIDGWAVRRNLVARDPAPVLPSLAAPERIALGRAMLSQFQDHLEALSGVAGVTAASHFPFLPPLGLLPGMDEAAAKAFFAGRQLRGPVHINAAQVEGLIRESLSAPAIDSGEESMIWLYAVAENLFEGARRLADAKVPDPYLVFARGDLPYRGDARFNLHRWNYANFALGSS